jgi:hypothetical protein
MIVAAMLMATALNVPANTEFFIVSSIDLPKNRVVLKRPTEVTVLATITPSTELRGEHGEHLRPADLRSGDTVYAVVRTEADGSLVLISVRRGPMTLEELHRRYLRLAAGTS